MVTNHVFFSILKLSLITGGFPMQNFFKRMQFSHYFGTAVSVSSFYVFVIKEIPLKLPQKGSPTCEHSL